MITQHQVRKAANAADFEQLTLIKDMIKSLQESKKSLEKDMVARGLGEFTETFIEEHMVKGHWRKTYKHLA
jgi:restriction endonuclease S subunit